MGGNMAAKMEAFHCGASSSSTGETEAAAAVRGEQPPPPLKLPLYVNLWKAAVFLCLFHLLRKRSTLTQTHRNAEPVKKGRSQLSEGKEIIFFFPCTSQELKLFICKAVQR